MGTREKLIEVAFNVLAAQAEIHKDPSFSQGTADGGLTILDGAYDLGAMVDAILIALAELDGT